MALKGQTRSFLGINLGQRTISLVELINRGPNVELAAYALTDTPADLRNALAANNTTSIIQLARFLSSVLEQASVSSDAVVFCLPNTQIFSTTVEIPTIPDKELPAAIFFKAQELIPTKLDEMIVTATRPGEKRHNVPLDITKKCQVSLSEATQYSISQTQLNEKTADTTQYLINAIPTDTINWYQQLTDNLQLDLVAIEAQIFPIMRIHPAHRPSSVIYVNIGLSETDIYIADSQSVRISRTLDLIPGPRTVDGLIAEILRIADKYQERGGRQPSQIYLLGTGAMSADFNKSLTSAFSIPVNISNPFSGLSYPKGIEQPLTQKGPLFTVAVGLAARQMNNL